MKQKKLITIISVVAGVIVLMGLIGGSVLAADPPTPTDAPKTPKVSYNARLAEKLGITQDKLETAISQVKKDIQMEALSARLDALVAAGKMTKEQAEKYKTWMGSKPTDLPSIPELRGGQIPQCPMMGPGFSGPQRFPQAGPQGGFPGGFGGRGKAPGPLPTPPSPPVNQ